MGLFRKAHLCFFCMLYRDLSSWRDSRLDYCDRISGGGKVLFAARHHFQFQRLWTHFQSHLKGDICPSLWRRLVLLHLPASINTTLQQHAFNAICLLHHPPFQLVFKVWCGVIFRLNANNMSRSWHTSAVPERRCRNSRADWLQMMFRHWVKDYISAISSVLASTSGKINFAKLMPEGCCDVWFWYSTVSE